MMDLREWTETVLMALLMTVGIVVLMIGTAVEFTLL